MCLGLGYVEIVIASNLIRFVKSPTGQFAYDCSLLMFVKQKAYDAAHPLYIVYFRVLLEPVRPQVYWR